MTVQFPVVALSASLLATRSALVRRLVRARNDPGKERISYAGTYARWQRDPEGIGGALRAKGARA